MCLESGLHVSSLILRVSCALHSVLLPLVSLCLICYSCVPNVSPLLLHLSPNSNNFMNKHLPAYPPFTAFQATFLMLLYSLLFHLLSLHSAAPQFTDPSFTTKDIVLNSKTSVNIGKNSLSPHIIFGHVKFNI